MRYTLFAVKDHFGEAVGVAGVTEQGQLFDPVYLEGRELDTVVRDLANSIKKTDKKARVAFTEEPDLHPDVVLAIKANAEDPDEAEAPEIKVEGFLCQTCSHVRVCAVANAIMTLRTVDIRVTSCEAYELKEKDNARKKKRV